MNVSNMMVSVDLGEDRITLTGPRGEVTEYLFSAEDLLAIQRMGRGEFEAAWRGAIQQ